MKIDPTHDKSIVPLPTNFEYHIVCRIEVKRVSYDDVQGLGKDRETHTLREADMVFLIPEQSTEMVKFLDAWLPEDETHNEVVMSLGSPVFGPCRGAVMRRNERCDRPHIMVMSVGPERDLIRENGRRMEITVLPESLDTEADHIPDPDMPDIKKV